MAAAGSAASALGIAAGESWRTSAHVTAQNPAVGGDLDRAVGGEKQVQHGRAPDRVGCIGSEKVLHAGPRDRCSRSSRRAERPSAARAWPGRAIEIALVPAELRRRDRYVESFRSARHAPVEEVRAFVEGAAGLPPTSWARFDELAGRNASLAERDRAPLHQSTASPCAGTFEQGSDGGRAGWVGASCAS